MKKIVKKIAAFAAAATMAVSMGVSASACSQDSAYDSQFLNDMRIAPDRFGEFYTEFHWSKVTTMVDKSWEKVGIRSICNYWGTNQYFLNGKEIKREEAYKYVSEKLGKEYDYKKYDITGNGVVHRHKKK